jgi:hypothetical protein
MKRIMVKNMLLPGRSMLFALVLGVAASAAPAAYLHGVTDAQERNAPIIVDWRTGVAMYGFDPVAYFSEAHAVQGLPELERVFSGASWQFRSEANVAAFAANPEIYRPRFGGYDPLAIGRGITTPGNPLVWLVFNKRLYLFHDPSTREVFAADPQRAIAAGEAGWPRLAQTLSR